MAYAEPPIPVGNPMKWTVVFKDGTGAAFDPASEIQITLVDPNGGSHVYLYPAQLTRDSLGTFSVTVEASIVGDWVGIGKGLLPDNSPVTTEKVAQKVI